MSHANALLTPKGRLRLARCIVDDGWPLRRAAERFQVSVTAAARRADPYREQGEDGMGARIMKFRKERVSDEDYDSWVELTVDADYFSCENCRLVLDGYELLSLSGLPVAFGVNGNL